MSENKKETYKKRQEDAKKKQLGELPPDLDEDGKMINPHNPDFITKVPWYLGESGPTLKHHNVQQLNTILNLNETENLILKKREKQKELKREKTIKYRKGACKNCGAVTHQEKDCVERPRSRKNSAWKTGILFPFFFCFFLFTFFFFHSLNYFVCLGVTIASDEVILDLEKYGKITYDAKRDQWQVKNNLTIFFLPFDSIYIFFFFLLLIFLSLGL